MKKSTDYLAKPDRKFTVEMDGFYGSYFEPEESRFPGGSLVSGAREPHSN